MPVDFQKGVDIALIPARSLCRKGPRNGGTIAIMAVAASEQATLPGRQ
jgi:hypothetical protein